MGRMNTKELNMTMWGRRRRLARAIVIIMVIIFVASWTPTGLGWLAGQAQDWWAETSQPSGQEIEGSPYGS